MKIRKVICIIIFIIGFIIFLFPHIANYIYQLNVEYMYEDFSKIKRDTYVTKEDELIQEEVEEKQIDPLLLAMKKYNEEIYENNQAGIADPFSFSTPCFDLSEFNIQDNIVGYISIEKIDITLPIYLGATKENMSKGATQLGCTSLPIGGINTNCVIAAHRGYSTKEMFRNIEELEIGDKIIIENYWETLEYEIVKTEVIDPGDINKILIQPQKDMITLSTCHPYRHNYQRYIVYAERIN